MKCEAGKVVLFATAGKPASKGFKGRRRPLKPRWAEQLAASMIR